MDAGLLTLRVVVGLLFAVHGTQKLFGWFGGHGLEGTAGFFGQLRYRQPRLAALAAGVFETGGGIFLALGLLTPLAAAAIVGVMLNAIFSAKLKAGLVGGYELDVLYAIAAVALAFTGAGAYSIDRAFGWELGGSGWGLASVGLGVAVSAMVLATRVPAEAVTERAAEAVEVGRRAA
jgi:putative oxidoreductase